MGSKAIAYCNSKGDLFASAEDATVSDLTILLENAPLARQVLALRASIEDIFTQHDGMLENHMLVLDPGD